MPNLNFDITTTFLIMVMLNITIGFTLLTSLKNQTRFGLNYFAAFILLQPLGLLFFLMIGKAPDWFVIPLANSLLSLSYSMGYVGFCRFSQRRVNKWMVTIPVILTYIGFSFSLQNFVAMVVIAGVISGVQLLVTFFVVLSVNAPDVRRSKPILLLAFGSVGIYFLIRAAHILFQPTSYSDLFDPIWINSLLLVISIISTALISLGILLMVSDRLMHENLELATRDFLTHLYNRQNFTTLAAGELNRASRSQTDISLLMVDIDKFKDVNDTFGHLAGDAVLIHLAGIFGHIFRTEDVCCRFGGEEFCVLLANTSEMDALKAAERLRNLVEKTSVPLPEGIIQYTISIGIKTEKGSQNISLDDLVRAADTALYQAKANGRNRVVVWNNRQN